MVPEALPAPAIVKDAQGALWPKRVRRISVKPRREWLEQIGNRTEPTNLRSKRGEVLAAAWRGGVGKFSDSAISHGVVIHFA